MCLSLLALAGCDASVPSPSASGSQPSAAAVARPAVQLDQDWTASNGDWTFTGQVDPKDDPTDVILQIGPGPITARVFDHQVPVREGVTGPGSLSVTTREIPDIEEICVRFSATNGGGTATTTPLCFPHDLPTIAPPGAPTVEIDDRWTYADGAWSFTVRVDPNREATDVVLDIGPGPAGRRVFDTHVPVSQDVTEQAALTFATKDVPKVEEACVRFTATNAKGSVSSDPLCFDPASPPS